MYCSDMSDPPMAASSKASVASAATCNDYSDRCTLYEHDRPTMHINCTEDTCNTNKHNMYIQMHNQFTWHTPVQTSWSI